MHDVFFIGTNWKQTELVLVNLPAQCQCCWFQAERPDRLMDSSSPSISLFMKHINFVIWSIKEGRKQALSKWTHSRKINDPRPARWDPVHLKSIYDREERASAWVWPQRYISAYLLGVCHLRKHRTPSFLSPLPPALPFQPPGEQSHSRPEWRWNGKSKSTNPLSSWKSVRSRISRFHAAKYRIHCLSQFLMTLCIYN